VQQSTTVFISPTKIHHGYGSTSLTGSISSSLGITTALIVTDRGVVNAGLLEGILRSLAEKEIHCAVFDDVEEDPDVETVQRGVSKLKRTNANGVIAVGGGSPICAAKGVALVATNGGEIIQYEGPDRYSSPPLPVVAIPTTAGSGSDVSRWFVLHSKNEQRTFVVGGDACFPRASILDPLLLATLPKWQFIVSGVDALTHAVEALWTENANPLTDAIAFESIALIMGNLPRAALTGDMEAKSRVHLAASMANIACGNAGLGIVHAMTLNYAIRLPHGLQNGILLPYAMEYNLPACVAKLARMAVVIGEQTSGLTDPELAARAIYRVKRLFVELGFPAKFQESDVRRELIPAMARYSAEQVHAKLNIRRTDENEIASLFHRSLEGWTL